MKAAAVIAAIILSGCAASPPWDAIAFFIGDDGQPPQTEAKP